MRHDEQDTDSSTFAIHHTLGFGPNQAAPGNVVKGILDSGGGGGGSIAIKDEGALISAAVAEIEFVGVLVVAALNGTGKVKVTIQPDFKLVDNSWEPGTNTDAVMPGSGRMTIDGTYYICVQGGTPGTWYSLAGWTQGNVGDIYTSLYEATY